MILPREIILDIIARLPLKTLGILCCVNKYLLHLISRPNFIKSRLKASTEDSDFSDYKVIFTPSLWNSKLKQCSLNSLMCECIDDFVRLDYPKKKPRCTEVRVKGSCNGLVCIAVNEKNLFLWNPLTGKSRKLPRFNIRKKNYFDIKCGVGFDKPNDDCKVVTIITLCEKQHILGSIAMIYSLNSNSWKMSADYTGDELEDELGIFASGNLHWLTEDIFYQNYIKDIVSFDVKREVFVNVDRPNYGEGRYELSLGVLEGCLCVLGNDQEKRGNVWVMKEYGVKESWNKMFTISYPENLDRHFPVRLRLGFVLPNGELFLHGRDHFAFYNSKDDSIRIQETKNNDGIDFPVIYVESLVSPTANGGRWKQQKQQYFKGN